MVTAARLSARGDFDHLCAVGPVRPFADDGDRHHVFHELALESTTCAGTFRDAGGAIVSVLRRTGSDWGLPLLMQSASSGAMRPHGDVAERAWSGAGLDEAIEDGRHRSWSRPRGPQQPFSLERTADAVTWDEGDALSVAGALVGDVGLQWYDPSPPGALLVAHIYRARGTVLGRAAEGFVALEQRYLPPGLVWADAPYEGGRLQVARTLFGTEWDDGSIEAGLLFAGRRRWAGALIAGSDGEAIATTDVAARVRRGADGWAEGISYRVLGDAWEWVADPAGRMPLAPAWAAGDLAQAEGLVRRAGDARTPAAWMARAETARRAR